MLEDQHLSNNTHTTGYCSLNKLRPFKESLKDIEVK